MAQDRPPARPLHERIAATFVAPHRLVDDFRAGTRWLDVLVIATLVAMLSVYLLPQEFFVEQMQGAVTRRGDPVDITSSPEEIARWGRYLGMITALASHPLFAVAIAGVLTLIFSTLGKGAATFRDHLALASHGLLIPALGSLLTVPLRFITGDPEADFSLSLLIPETDSFLAVLLAGLDAFSIWMLLVLGLWAGKLNPRVGVRRATVILLGLYLALNALTALLIL